MAAVPARNTTGASRWMDIRIRTKLYALSAGLLVFLAVVAGTSLYRMNGVKVQGAEVREQFLPSIQALGRLDFQSGDVRSTALEEVAAVDATERTKLDQQLQDQLKTVEATAATYEPLINTDAERQLWNQYQTQWKAYLDAQTPALATAKAGDAASAHEQLVQARDEFETSSTTLTKLEDVNDRAAATSGTMAETDYTDARTTVLLLAIVALLLGSALAWKIAAEISGRLAATTRVLDRVKGGDFTARVGIESRDELGVVAIALDATIATTQHTLTMMADQSQTLAAAAEELSAISSQLNTVMERTSIQAEVVSSASLQASNAVTTVAASSEEMGATVAEIARTSSSATDVVNRAVAVTSDAAGAVHRLSDASIEIGAIVEFIEGIAAQTNLLALNATIEAARAGESGRGFAVVASEVKDLASETGQATERIRRTIEIIQRDSTGAMEAMDLVNTIITSINDNQVTISSAVEEQTAATREISRTASEVAAATGAIAESINEVAEATTETGLSAGQVTETAHEVAKMAAEMRELVSRFTY